MKIRLRWTPWFVQFSLTVQTRASRERFIIKAVKALAWHRTGKNARYFEKQITGRSRNGLVISKCTHEAHSNNSRQCLDLKLEFSDAKEMQIEKILLISYQNELPS